MEDAKAGVSAKSEAPQKNNKMMIYIIIAVITVALIILGVSGTVIVSRNNAEKASRDAQQQAAKNQPMPELYYSITPAFIVNFQTLGRIRYMQVGVDIMTRDPKVIDIIKDNQPLIKNNLLALFDAQDFDVMTTAQGRQALREAALEEVQKIVQAKLGKPGVEAVLFTSFIIQ